MQTGLGIGEPNTSIPIAIASIHGFINQTPKTIENNPTLVNQEESTLSIMADDVPPASGCNNPSCIELNKKYSVLEKKKNKFRDYAKRLYKKLEEVDTENANLKKASERIQADPEKEKESSIRNELEKEVQKLKEEISSYQKSEVSKSSYEDEIVRLEACVLEKEIQMAEVKECLEKEKKNCASEKKKAKAAKERAEQAQKLLNVEKDRAEQEQRHAESERKKSDKNDCKLLEARILEREAEIKRITELLEKEKMKAKAEKERTAEAQKLLIMENSKAEEERRRAERRHAESERKKSDKNDCKLLQARILEREAEIKRITELLEKEKMKAKAEKEKTAEAQKLLIMEKSKAEEERRRAESERKKAEDSGIFLERLKYEFNEVRGKLVVEKSKADNAIQQVDTEKQKTCREKMRADSERTEAEEQRKLMEVETKKALEEKVRADRLSQHLEMEKQRREELKKKIEILSAQRGRNFSCKNSESADAKLLKEKLKLEKKRVRYAERLTRLEKAEKEFIGQQVNLLKHELIQLSCRLNMLDNCLSYSTEGKEGPAKIIESPEAMGFNLHKKFLGLRPCNFDSRSDHGLLRSYNDLVNYPDSTKECTGPHISGGSFTRPIPGISSELEFPIKDSVRNKSQSSAVSSATATFSDRTFMGSQERDDLCMTTASKFKRSSSTQRLVVPKLACVVGNVRQNEDDRIAAQNMDGGHTQLNAVSMQLNTFARDGTDIVADRISGRPTKKRRIRETLKCITRLYSEDNQLHLKMDGELSTLKNLLSFEGGLSQVACSPPCKTSNYLCGGRDTLTKKHDSLCKHNCRCGKNTLEDEQQNQNQPDIFEDEGIMEPCFQYETAEPDIQMLENVDPQREESNTAVSSGQVPSLFFENLVCGDYLKLLDLDNEDDERRYKIAMETPLSPTLPVLECPRVQLYGEDESHYLAEGQLICSGSGGDRSVSSCSFDVINIEIKSNMVKSKTSNTRVLMPDNIKDFSHSYEEPKSSGGESLYSASKHNGKCYGPELDSFVGKRGLDVEQMCDFRESNILLIGADLPLSNLDPKGFHTQAKPLIQCLPDENTTAESCNDDIPGKNNKYFPSSHVFSNSLGGSKQLSEELANNQVPNSGTIKCYIEDQGKQVDITIVAKTLKHGPPETGMRKSTDGGKNIFAAGQPTQTSSPLVSDSSTIIEARKHMPLATGTILEDPCKGDKTLENIPKYCILFSDTKDENSISRIIQARNTLIYQNFMAKEELFITEVLHALKVMTDLLPEEKVSVFFSLLLPKFLITTSANSESISCGDIFFGAESFATNINRAITEEETKWVFQEICKIEILLKLIEDFLINRKILVYNDLQSEKLLPPTSSSNIFWLDGGSMSLFYTAAKFDQLATAGFVLACFCDAVGRIGFLLEASYKILRICRNDTSWILLALHTFHSAIGDKFLTTKSYEFVIDAIKSLVLLLETGNASLSNVSPLSSSSDKGPSFSPCEQCPFHSNAVSVDKLTSFLLDLLQDYVSGVRQPNLSKSIHTVPLCAGIDEGRICSTYEFDCLNMDCDESCMIFKYNKNAMNQHNCTSERSFCHYTDLVSLLELFGCYMSWEWTCTDVIPRLLELMEQCVYEEFSTGLIVLIGQLARFGVDAGGYWQSGIVKLRCTLSRFLDAVIARKWSFLAQVTVVGALLNLIPLRYGEIVDGDMEHSLDTSQSSHAKLIKEWFSQLSRELKSLTMSLFSHTDVQKF